MFTSASLSVTVSAKGLRFERKMTSLSVSSFAPVISIGRTLFTLRLSCAEIGRFVLN